MKKLFFLTLLASLQVFATDLIQQRKEMILKAFNAKPENLIEPLELSDIELGAYEGRVVVNKKAKFTYYVHVSEATNANSEIVLIPMSTSRYTPTYYQTDEWWDAHKAEMDAAKREGRPMPKQDMNEVATWLEEMKLTTNPDVIVISKNKTVSRKPLQEHLSDIYIKKFTVNGKVTLFRGAERENELQSWKNKQTPKGARYWTPTANYAWRYARKNKEFLDLMIKGETPLFKFEIPVAEFKQMVLRSWPRLTLGTELTKNAHNIFDRSLFFGDHLYGSFPFLGIGSIGLEFELRSNKAGADEMVKYFSGPVTVSDLAKDRIQVLESTLARLKDQRPADYETQSRQILERIETVKLEKEIIDSIMTGDPKEKTTALIQKASRVSTFEIANIDGLHFSSWAQKLNANRPQLICGRLFE
jgi:hypothetical protein